MANARERGAKARLAKLEASQEASQEGTPSAASGDVVCFEEEALARVSEECEDLRGLCGGLRQQCEALQALLVSNEEERAGLHAAMEALAAQKSEAEAEISRMQRRMAELEVEGEARQDTLMQISQPSTPSRSRASSLNLSSGAITPRLSFSDKEAAGVPGKVDCESLPEDVEY